VDGQNTASLVDYQVELNSMLKLVDYELLNDDGMLALQRSVETTQHINNYSWPINMVWTPLPQQTQEHDGLDDGLAIW